MTIDKLYQHIKQWVTEKFTGIITIHFHQGGIRIVEKKEKVG